MLLGQRNKTKAKITGIILMKRINGDTDGMGYRLMVDDNNLIINSSKDHHKTIVGNPMSRETIRT